MTKICVKCNIEQSIDNYNKEKNTKDGLRGECKLCRKAYRDGRKNKNKEYYLKYYQEHKQDYRQRTKKFREKNPNYRHPRQKLWDKNNREKINALKRKRYHERKNDIIFKLIYRVRNRTKNAVRRKYFRKDFKYPDYIGCSREELKMHIESQFTEGMTWDKFLAGEIHIDHIVPIGKAQTPEEIFKLSHYTNLRPLWAKDNLKKGAK